MDSIGQTAKVNTEHPRDIVLTIQPSMLDELLLNKIPPDSTLAVINSVMAVLDETQSLQKAKKVMSNRQAFLTRLVNFPCESLALLKVKQIKQYLAKSSYQEKTIKKTNQKGTIILSQWVHSLVQFSENKKRPNTGLRMKFQSKNQSYDNTINKSTPRQKIKGKLSMQTELGQSPVQLRQQTPMDMMTMDTPIMEEVDNEQQETNLMNFEPARPMPFTPTVINEDIPEALQKFKLENLVDDNVHEYVYTHGEKMKNIMRQELAKNIQADQLYISKRMGRSDPMLHQGQYNNFQQTELFDGLDQYDKREESYNVGSGDGIKFRYSSPVHGRYDQSYMEKFKRKEIKGNRDWVR